MAKFSEEQYIRFEQAIAYAAIQREQDEAISRQAYQHAHGSDTDLESLPDPEDYQAGMQHHANAQSGGPDHLLADAQIGGYVQPGECSQLGSDSAYQEITEIQV